MHSFKAISALAIASSLLLVQNYISFSNATPIMAINRLPSITVDTLYPKVEDNEPSQSMTFIRTMVEGSDAFHNQFRPKQQEARYVTLFRLPWRIARSVSETGYGVARGLMGSLAHQMSESYKHVQRNVIPQASQAFYTWAHPPRNPVNTAWLDDGV